MNTDMNRVNKMKQMRNSGKSLQEIADVYSISRERVRQIIGNTGKSFLRTFAVAKLKSVEYSFDTTRDDIKNNIKRFKGMFLKKLATVPHKTKTMGQDAEIIVSEKLRDLGFENSLMRSGYSFDILLDNGIKVDVKASYKKGYTSKKQISGMYAFKVRKDKKGDYCDYFICYIPDHNIFFVIPNNKVNYINALYIPWPITSRNWTPWAEYKDRFDLLKK